MLVSAGARISSASVSSSSQLSLRTALGPKAAVAVTATVSAPEVRTISATSSSPPSTGTPSIASSCSLSASTDRGPWLTQTPITLYPARGARRRSRSSSVTVWMLPTASTFDMYAPASRCRCSHRRQTNREASSATRPAGIMINR